MATLALILSTLFLSSSLSLGLQNNCQSSNISYIWNQLQLLLQNASKVIDLNISTDKKTLNNIRTSFPSLLTQYCSCSVTINDSFICDVIKVSLKIVSSSIKETLSKYNRTTLSHTDIQLLAPWRYELLVTTLKYCPSFDINKLSCPGNLTPLEYSIQLGLFNTSQWLLNITENVSMYNVLSLAVASQNKELINLIMKKETYSSDHYTRPIEQIVSLHCWLNEWGCHIWKSMIDNKKQNNIVTKLQPNKPSTLKGTLPISLINSTLLTYTTHQSLPTDKLLTCSDINRRRKQWKTNPYYNYYNYYTGGSSGGWLIYEGGDDHLLGKLGCDMLVLNAQYLTVSSFSVMLSLKIPILLTNVPYFTRLSKIWTKANLIKHYSNVDLLAGSIPYGQVFGEHFGLATIKEFINYMDRYSYNPLNFDNGKKKLDKENDDQLPLYVFDGQVMDEIFKPFFEIPDIYSLWNNSEFFHQFIFGPRGSGAPFHYHCSAINYLAYGRKKWFLYPPGKSMYSKVHPLHWLKKEYESLPDIDKPIECIQNKNEIIYVPSGWSHSTLNIDECVGMATEFNTDDC